MRKLPRGPVALDLELFRKRGDERLRKRAFGKQVAQQVGDLEGEVKRVQTLAVEAREDHFPRQAEHPAGHHRGADFPCGFAAGHVGIPGNARA
jgi:hypothetical protein